MRVKSELVVCSAINPKGLKLFVEVASLMLLPTIFYDRGAVDSDELDVVDGWLTIIGFKPYRVHKIPEHAVTQVGTHDHMAFYQVTVNWDDLDVKPIAREERH